MKSWLISFGQTAEHSYWFVQQPNPSSSIAGKKHERAKLGGWM
jgi:hypothetical protein